MEAATASAPDWRRELDTLDAKVSRLKLSDAPETLLTRVYDTFGRDNTGEALETAIDIGCRIASSMMQDEESGQDARKRIDGILQTLYYVNQAYSATLVGNRLLSSTGDESAEVTDGELAAGVARFSKMELEDANKVQQLLLYMLNSLQARGLRRVDGDLYRRLYTVDGHDTHAWVRECGMRDFVYEATRKEINYDMWLALTGQRVNMMAVVEHLTHCRDVQLPDLRKDRHVFSFNNGVYLAAKDEFVPYGTARAAALPTDLVAAKYFDLPADAYDETRAGDDDWFGIPTPRLQSILDFQDMDAAVSSWMYVLIGRLMYDVNELDGWQVLPFLKGTASSGKSTIIMRVCRSIYEHNDVGVMSNNLEKKFGLSAFCEKLMFIGPEIKGDACIEQADFQSIVSGETVQVAVKFKTAQAIEWSTPGILAGNELPAWVDNSGSVNRRIVLFEFPNKVENGDMELGKKLELEMPAILIKANRAYLSATRRFARDNVWKHLPPPFHRAKQDFAESANSIVHFLASGQLEFGGPEVYMPLDDFSRAYKAYADTLGLTKIKMSKESLLDPLISLQCRQAKVARTYPRGRGGTMRFENFLIGLDLASARADENEVDPLGG
jgi:hypothetical protein